MRLRFELLGRFQFRQNANRIEARNNRQIIFAFPAWEDTSLKDGSHPYYIKLICILGRTQTTSPDTVQTYDADFGCDKLAVWRREVSANHGAGRDGQLRKRT